MIIRWGLEEDDVLLEIDGTEISQARTAGTAHQTTSQFGAVAAKPLLVDDYRGVYYPIYRGL